jgi:hypothetical protein
MPSRRKATTGLAVSVLAVVGSLGLFLTDTDDVVLLVIAIGMGVLVVLWTRRLLRPSPTLMFSDDGLRIRDDAFIPWESLERLDVFRIQARFLGFQVADPKEIRLPANFAQRTWRALNRQVEGAPVSITENLIEGRFEDVVPLILRYKAVPVRWDT